MISNEILFFSVFIVAILFVLLLDLGVFNKKSHALSFKESIAWCSVWVLLALIFFSFLKLKGNWIHGISTNDDIKIFIEKYSHPVILGGNNLNENLALYNNNLSLEFIKIGRAHV